MCFISCRKLLDKPCDFTRWYICFYSALISEGPLIPLKCPKRFLELCFELTSATPNRRHTASNASSSCTHELILLPSLEPLRRTGHLWKRERASLLSTARGGTAARPARLRARASVRPHRGPTAEVFPKDEEESAQLAPNLFFQVPLEIYIKKIESDSKPPTFSSLFKVRLSSLS